MILTFSIQVWLVAPLKWQNLTTCFQAQFFIKECSIFGQRSRTRLDLCMHKCILSDLGISRSILEQDMAPARIASPIQLLKSRNRQEYSWPGLACCIEYSWRFRFPGISKFYHLTCLTSPPLPPLIVNSSVCNEQLICFFCFAPDYFVFALF